MNVAHSSLQLMRVFLVLELGKVKLFLEPPRRTKVGGSSTLHAHWDLGRN